MKKRFVKKQMNTGVMIIITLCASLSLQGCSTLKSIFGMNKKTEDSKPIDDPFGNYSSEFGSPQENIVFRTKKGDRAVEVEIPEYNKNMTDLVMPVTPAFQDKGTSYSSNEPDSRYKERRPTSVDREIASVLPQTSPDEEWKRSEVETGLGLIPTENITPKADTSYLGSIDYIKQLYKSSRFEAALIEVDQAIREYPTDARLYEMRGTLLERMGFSDLAMKSWQQALEYNPNNQSLKRFMEKKITKTEKGNVQ